MGRRRKSFNFAISSKVTFTVLGLLLGLLAVVLLLSFLHFLSGGSGSGKFLAITNQYLMGNFGGISFGIPFLLFLLAGHCFNSKKFTLIHWHTSTGTFFFLLGALGLFGAGSVGSSLQNTLYEGFTGFGGRFIFITLITVGIVLFFDIEPQTIISVIVSFVKNLSKSDNLKVKNVKEHEEYIKDIKTSHSKDAGTKEIKQPVLDEFISDTSQGKSQKVVSKIEPPVIVKKPVLPVDMMQVNQISQSQQLMWVYPPLELLHDVKSPADRGDTQANAAIIESTLRSFGIKARVTEVNPGPTVTQYALEIGVGTNIQEIVKKSSNLALALASTTGTVRIEAPIPGRALVGIEIPNKRAELVTIKRLLESKVFKESHDPLLVPLGLDVAGETQAVSIANMPHVLIAGTTGSGKSVMVNSWITTILCRTKPSDLRLVLIDPKQVELTCYNGVPHLLTEVITDASKVVNALRWAVAEMETRYKMLRMAGVRNLESYNQIPNIDKKPYVLFFIDELADLMMTSRADIEGLIVRIAQKARAVGIHLILSTQRPSVNVITGLMKANIPTRLAFNVASGVDSKVILDTVGAENLVGKGDMFYSAPTTPRPKRIQGPFVSDKEVGSIVQFIRHNNPLVQYTEEVTETPKEEFVGANGAMIGGSGNDRDPYFNQAIELIQGADKASASLFQRRLKVGYARAARILDELQTAGYVGPAEGSKPREILIKASHNSESSPLEMIE